MNAYDQGPALDAPEFESSEEPRRRKAKAPARRGSARLMAGLLVLSALPLAFGALRLTQLAGGPAIMPARAGFDASPLPVVLHLASATVYAILARSSSHQDSGGAGRAGTAPPGGSWLDAGWWSGCPGCG